ncbi:hypothetical protein ARAM_003565 [Aspergillus rambellii]|uniref:Store-operated calcium entry-associated regulatory factor n=2 Tax=Aspergillus subgen. Nidulantes TaxID=2720870 RepID=A0A0F8UTS2_9EURO|nr:hypothetical protein ARAM_003565 [Aspergillus rambellii]KKK16262.1 hypothetical protein AOCH_003623 [Aspergillus ochraceoroseus]
MRSVTTFQLFLFLLGLSSPVLSGKSQKPPGKNAILLSQVHALTLHGGRLTSSRRVSPVPQLKCVGPSKRICDLYEIDTMRCTNAGYGYDEDDVQWTCTASLPPELKLGSTDVICEGYRNSDDPWVLKGSCGVEYRMLLTDLGEEKFGYNSYDFAQRGHRPGKLGRTMDRGIGEVRNLVAVGVVVVVAMVAADPTLDLLLLLLLLLTVAIHTTRVRKIQIGGQDFGQAYSLVGRLAMGLEVGTVATVPQREDAEGTMGLEKAAPRACHPRLLQAQGLALRVEGNSQFTLLMTRVFFISAHTTTWIYIQVVLAAFAHE